jgi:hypothetical protein
MLPDHLPVREGGLLSSFTIDELKMLIWEDNSNGFRRVRDNGLI